MQRRTFIQSIGSALLIPTLPGCADSEVRDYFDYDEGPFEIPVSFADNIPKQVHEALMDGFNMWRTISQATAVQVGTADEPHVRILLLDEPCDEDGDDKPVGGTANVGTNIIEYHGNCFYVLIGTLGILGYKEHMTKLLGAHEWGHLLGCAHVPIADDCRSRDVDDDLCGLAVMNPIQKESVHKDIHLLPATDWQAFYDRTRKDSILNADTYVG